jgi:transposase
MVSGMTKPLVSDELWDAIEPLLPPEPPKPKGGRPRLPDRACLTGIVFVLRSDIPWEMLPHELGCRAGMTCWRRLRELRGRAPGIASTAPCRTGSARPAKSTGAGHASIRPASRPKGGRSPNSTDHGKPGTKRHVVVDRRGTPLATCLTGANRPDAVPYDALIDAVPRIQQPVGTRRMRHADKAYDIPSCRRSLRRRHIPGRIARTSVESRERLGGHRWVIERTMAWLTQFRRLTVRYERRADIHAAFLSLGCSLICCNTIKRFC